MTDREMLELAAKAAGIELTFENGKPQADALTIEGRVKLTGKDAKKLTADTLNELKNALTMIGAFADLGDKKLLHEAKALEKVVDVLGYEKDTVLTFPWESLRYDRLRAVAAELLDT